MVEPFGIRLDIKRNTSNKLLYWINGGIDNVQVNLGQKDFSTFLHVWAENFEYGNCIDEISYMLMPQTCGILEDQDFKKIQVFFNHKASIHEIDFKFTIDGVQIAFFANSDEVSTRLFKTISFEISYFRL